MADHVHHRVGLRVLEVVAVDDLGPRYRRVVLGGPQLGAFQSNGFEIAPFRSDAPDDHVKIFLPEPGETEPVLPVQDDGHLDWPTDRRPIHRDYTVRRHDPATGELVLEFVLHGDGPGARWAAGARPGDRLHIAGPRTSHVFPPSDHVVLLGDETALPAICRWVEELTDGSRATVVVEVEAPGDELPIVAPETATVDVVYVHRSEGRRLLDGLRNLADLAPDAFYFVAGEHATVTAVRAELLGPLGVDRARTYASGYWRRGVADPEAEDVTHGLALIEMVDLLTPYAVRVMATLGLADLIGAGTDTVVGLATATDCDPDTLGAVVAHLVHKGVLAEDGGRLSLTGIGLLLVDGHPFDARQRLTLDGAEGRMDAAWAGLLHAVRTGQPGFDAVFGTSFWDAVRADPDFGRSFDEYIARWAEGWVPAAAAAHDWTRYRHIADVGGGSGLLLAAVLDQAPDARGTVVELPTAVDAARERFESSGLGERATAVVGDFFGTLPAADAVVLAQVLHDWPDTDAQWILGRAAEAAGAEGRVLLIERLLDHGSVGAHGYVHLLMRNLFAATERRLTDFERLAAAAGLGVESVTPIGAELSLVELAPRP